MSAAIAPSPDRRPRVGFLGTGHIGQMRMCALVEHGLVVPAAISDPSPEMAGSARALAGDAVVAASFEALLDQDLDGLVIATPSALHAAQSIAALERGLAVFCQKPLGRTEREVRAVIAAAQRADRLLGVDLSYRHTEGMRAIRDLVRQGELGEIFAIDLTFHNAYGPDKPWFFDKGLSGGGCVMDLGVHLVDLALWLLDFPEIASVAGQLFSKGSPIARDGRDVEDFATATVTTTAGTVIRLACSWHLHAGRDAVIGAEIFGTLGGASFANVGGSFFDFAAHHHTGTSSRALATPPDAWSGRAITAWAEHLALDGRFDPSAEHYAAVARVLDRIYGR